MIITRRSELQKRLRIEQMLQSHAERNNQPEAAERYRKKARSIINSMGSTLGWITRSSRTY